MLKCGFYEKEITPPLGFNLPGYFNFRPGADVKDRLYAKALVVSNGSEKVAIIAIDSCHAFWKYRERIVARVAKYTDIKADNIIFSSNHSHTAIPDERSHVIDGLTEYIRVVYDLIADCIILADKRLESCTITYGKGTVEGISFVRDYFMKSATPQTNPGRLNPDIDKPVTDIDSDLPVVFFVGEDGTPRGAITSFACHQDCVGGEDYSGDFSSSLSYELKKVYGSEFVSLFMLGACGNINHFNVNTAEDAPDHYVKMGKIIAGEALKVIANAEPISGDELAARLEVLSVPRQEVPEDEIANAKHVLETVVPIEGIKIAADGTDPDQYAYAMADKLMSYVNGPKEFDVPLQAVRIGDLVIYAYSGEIFCQFGKALKAETGASKCIVATQCNETIGYVPTSDMFYDTIYESKPGSCKLYKGAGDMLTDKLLELGNKIL